MALDKTRYARREETVRRGLQGGVIRRPQEGRNIVRVFTFNHKVQERDFGDVYSKSLDKVKVGAVVEELDVMRSRHFVTGGAVNCIGKDCPYCADARKSGDRKDVAKRQHYVNAVNMLRDDREVAVYALPPSAFAAILGYYNDPDYGEEIFGLTGRDIVIELNKSAPPAQMYSVRLRDAAKSEALPKALLAEVKDLIDLDLLRPEGAGSGAGDELNPANKEGFDEELDKEKPETAFSKGKGAARKVAEEEEEAKPAPKKGGKKWIPKVNDDVCFMTDDGELAGKVKAVKGDKLTVKDVFGALWEVGMDEVKEIE